MNDKAICYSRCSVGGGKWFWVTYPWTAGQVKRAFRRTASKARPDAGGECEEFKAVCRAYEEALGRAVKG